MQPLFNGKDLSGWDGDPRLWSVKDGAIHGETTAENKAKGNTFIIWKGGTLKDFDLRLSFRCNATNNSRHPVPLASTSPKATSATSGSSAATSTSCATK